MWSKQGRKERRCWWAKRGSPLVAHHFLAAPLGPSTTLDWTLGINRSESRRAGQAGLLLLPCLAPLTTFPHPTPSHPPSLQWKKHWFVLTDSSLKYYRDSSAEEVSPKVFTG